MDYLLTPATDRQTQQISEIWEAGWHEAHAEIVPARLRALRTTESFRQRTRDNVRFTQTAICDGTVLGFCMVKKNELYQMYVSPSARGSGVAQALMKDAERRIGVNGYKTAWLACAVGNERAARFYEKSGWVNRGEKAVDLDTSSGTFPLDVWRFEKNLRLRDDI